jgi:hypothetical protein
LPAPPAGEALRWRRDEADCFRTVYHETAKEVGSVRRKKIAYDFGFLARVKNPFGPSGTCIIASGNHGAGTYGCMSVLSSPELFEKIVEQAGDAEFQAVIGIEPGELFRLGDPVVHKVVRLGS